MAMQKYSDLVEREFGISVIDTHYYRPNLASSHLMSHENSAVFVHVGATPALPRLLAALTQKSLAPEDVTYVILTHIHLDHAGCAGALMKACPNARLVVHKSGAKHMINPTTLIDATISIYGQEAFDHLYQEIVPVPEDRVTVPEDGEIIDWRGRPLQFIDTPGHARHHFCIWDADSKGVFTGDTLGIAYPELQADPENPFQIPTTSPVGFEPDPLIDSIERLCNLKPDYFYLTHYGPVKVSETSVAALKEMIEVHETIGLEAAGNHELLKEKLLELYYQSLEKNCPGFCDKARLESAMSGDLELNAAGVEVWLKRKHKS